MAKQDQEIKDKFVNLILDELTIKAVCSKLNLSRQTVYRWMKEDLQFKKDIKNAIENCILDINDDCESRIIRGIRNDDTNMIKFWLRYRHPDYKQSYIVTK